jgi:hypothetical protein
MTEKGGITMRKVNVATSHIEDGMRGHSNQCAIALAVKDQWEIEYVEVEGEYIFVHEDSYLVSYSLPEEARRFVQSFDEGVGVSPIGFEVETGTKLRLIRYNAV